MHCGHCGDTTVEVRPCHIHTTDAAVANIVGDVYLCRPCATNLKARCQGGSVFITWAGFPCDECQTVAAFDGDIPGCPDGIVCEDCTPTTAGDWAGFMPNDELKLRGSWLCETCYDRNHHGHPQKQLQPILDRLARIQPRTDS